MTEPKYTTTYSKMFLSEFEKLSGNDKKRVMKKIRILREAPYYPSLRTKKLRGNAGYYESSVNMDIRIIWEFDEDNRMVIVMIDVGHHDILKKY